MNVTFPGPDAVTLNGPPPVEFAVETTRIYSVPAVKVLVRLNCSEPVVESSRATKFADGLVTRKLLLYRYPSSLRLLPLVVVNV